MHTNHELHILGDVGRSEKRKEKNHSSPIYLQWVLLVLMWQLCIVYLEKKPQHNKGIVLCPFHSKPTMRNLTVCMLLPSKCNVPRETSSVNTRSLVKPKRKEHFILALTMHAKFYLPRCSSRTGLVKLHRKACPTTASPIFREAFVGCNNVIWRMWWESVPCAVWDAWNKVHGWHLGKPTKV